MTGSVNELRRAERDMAVTAFNLKVYRHYYSGIASRLANFSALQNAAVEKVESYETLLADARQKEKETRVRVDRYSLLLPTAAQRSM